MDGSVDGIFAHNGVASDLRLGLIPLLGFVCWKDLSVRQIPNWLCAMIGLIGFIVQTSMGFAALGISVGIALLLFAVLVPVHAIGGLGGGDVKLIAAVAVGFQPIATYRMVVATILAGGVIAVVHLTLRLLPPPKYCRAGAAVFQRVWTVERWRVKRHGSVPYGIAIALGAFWALFVGWEI